MIQIIGLTKDFPTKNKVNDKNWKRAVDKLTLSIGKGEIFGLLGPNGAGKSTTINMLTMQMRPTEGEIRYGGCNVKGNEQAIKSLIGVVPQSINFDNDLTVGENMELHGRLHHIPADERKKRIAELMEFVELSDTVNERPRALSGGMRRRLLIARALIHNPSIVFMDEPTVALDPQVRRRIWDLIRTMASRGTTVLLTTHYIEEAEELCNRVAIMNKGRLVAIDTPMAFCQRLGQYTVEWDGAAGREYSFFAERQAAVNFLETAGDKAHIRRTNLEDVFIEMTGRREGL